LTLIHGRFSEMDSLLGARGMSAADGIALDLGVSSFQFDQPERGFSFREDGPLDMRMDVSLPRTAADLVNTAPESDLVDILRSYGEEERAKQVARAIVAARPITRTGELAAVVEGVLGKGAQRIHPATRTFQALRIAVNDELAEIEQGLDAAERMLAVEGTLADRAGRKGRGSRHTPDRSGTIPATFELLGKQPQFPRSAEIATNPRARSARLRAAKRTRAPARTSTANASHGGEA
jgi:16S rRNA (cytosine1402-N4)-methyltransferase